MIIVSTHIHSLFGTFRLRPRFWSLIMIIVGTHTHTTCLKCAFPTRRKISELAGWHTRQPLQAVSALSAVGHRVKTHKCAFMLVRVKECRFLSSPRDSRIPCVLSSPARTQSNPASNDGLWKPQQIYAQRRCKLVSTKRREFPNFPHSIALRGDQNRHYVRV